MKRNFAFLVLALALMLPLAACNPNVPEVVTSTPEVILDDIGDAGKDVADDIGDAAKDVTDDIKNGVKNATR